MTHDSLIQVDKISKTFSANNTRFQALQPISFDIAPREFVCLLGPSGSGKSTLLRIIGGLVPADGGTVWFQGQPLREPHPAIGFVFQKPNLMPWRTVLDNVLLPVEVQQRHISADSRATARELLAMVGLHEFEQAYPSHLSGGMSQRVALARALLHQPQLLLLDEPFGALDAITRERLNLELLRIHTREQTTVLMVTHDIDEAVLLADRILVLSDRPGRLVADLPIPLSRPRQIAQLGSPQFGELALHVRRLIGEVA